MDEYQLCAEEVEETDPTKQGLKHDFHCGRGIGDVVEETDPTKQGLKL